MLCFSKKAKALLGISIRHPSMASLTYIWQAIRVCPSLYKRPKESRSTSISSSLGSSSCLYFVTKFTRHEWQASYFSQMPKTDKSSMLMSFRVSSRFAPSTVWTSYCFCGDPSAKTLKEILFLETNRMVSKSFAWLDDSMKTRLTA